MNKIIENLKRGNYSVVDNQGVSITQHFIECLEKEFADPEAKLAEKESEINVGEFWHSAYQGKQLDYDKIYAELRQSYDEVEELKQQLHQIYSHLGVEAFCEDIHEQALKEIGRLQEQLAEKETRIAELEDKDWYEALIKQLEEQNGRLIEERYNANLQLAESKKAYTDLKELEQATTESLYASREYLEELKSQKWALEQQLAEKERENLTLFSMLYETLEKQGCENITSTIEQMTNLTLEKQSNWFKENCVKDQDKISFAVEKLVGVQKYISDNAVFVEEECFGREINDYIDNQIKELKEGK